MSGKKIITINGHRYPEPQRGLTFAAEIMYDTGINANGVVVGQKVGRTRNDFANLQWAYLSAEVWSNILVDFETSGMATITSPDMAHNTMITRSVMIESYSATPYHIDDNGMPLDYLNCTLKVRDMGA